MSNQRTATSSRLWNRTTKALGRFFAGMLSSPDRRRSADEAAWNDYPRFPPY